MGPQMCCATAPVAAPVKSKSERFLGEKSQVEEGDDTEDDEWAEESGEEDSEEHDQEEDDQEDDQEQHDQEEDGQEEDDQQDDQEQHDQEQHDQEEDGQECDDQEEDNQEEDDENHRTLNIMPTAESLASAGIESADGLPPEAHEPRTGGETGTRSSPGPEFGQYTGESSFFDEFTVVLYRGDDFQAMVGLEVATFDLNFTQLQVLKVKPGGLIENWNLTHPDKAVKEGDLLVEVNGVNGSATGMLNRIVLDKVSEILVRRHT